MAMNVRNKKVQQKYIVKTACCLSCCVLLKTHQQALKTIPAERCRSLVNLCWKQNTDLGVVVQLSAFTLILTETINPPQSDGNSNFGLVKFPVISTRKLKQFSLLLHVDIPLVFSALKC